MRAKLIITLALALLTAAETPAVHDFLRPLNLDRYPPGEDVPHACASFFSQTGWGDGAWDDKRPHELHIIQIDAGCNVKLLYGYGSWEHDGTGEWLSLSGAIGNNQLTVPIDIYAADVTYTLSADGSVLLGTFKSRDGTRLARVRLTRI